MVPGGEAALLLVEDGDPLRVATAAQVEVITNQAFEAPVLEVGLHAGVAGNTKVS